MQQQNKTKKKQKRQTHILLVFFSHKLIILPKSFDSLNQWSCGFSYSGNHLNFLSLSCVESLSSKRVLSLFTKCKATQVIQKVTLKISNFFKKEKKANPISINVFIIIHTKHPVNQLLYSNFHLQQVNLAFGHRMNMIKRHYLQ